MDRGALPLARLSFLSDRKIDPMRTFRLWTAALIAALAVPFPAPARAQESGDAQTKTKRQGRRNPPRAAADAEMAARAFRRPQGLAVEVYAAEPLLANPVAFVFNEHGELFVAETFRHTDGVPDTRGHLNWLNDDLACRTVADRVAMYRKYLGSGFPAMGREEERIRRIVDRNGDGRADHADVFVGGYRDPAAGIGAGLLARGETVWYACIPWLYRYDGVDPQGRAKKTTLLHEGYGVHVGFLGHDLHGLTFGPDGRIYFSIGDRALNVKTREGKTLTALESGSVLRCEPDGSELELFATGLRNPQELAFNEVGDLFSCDNNSDSGDRARWVHLLEGGDSGWRIGYQFMEGDYSRGPWNEERLWYPSFPGQAAFIVPPLANISDGPSGLAFNPGVTLLPERYRGHFFLVDFRGASGQSGIRSFALEPAGATYRLTDSEQFVWRALATDVDFGPDGGLYFSDWVEGWNKTGKGRMYRVLDPARKADPKVREVREMLRKGFAASTLEELKSRLGYPDRRVRLEAQWALVARGEQGLKALAQAFGASKDQLARLHAIWGLGQTGRQNRSLKSQAIVALRPLLGESEPEVRVQAAKMLGELGDTDSAPRLITLLSDSNPRVQSAAAIAIGKLKSADAGAPLLALLRARGNDPFVRHAAVMGLAGTPAASWKAGANDASASVRMGVLLADRRTGDPAAAEFLHDRDPLIGLEAARAIHDAPINQAMDRLAMVEIDDKTPIPLARRVISASARVGGQAQASRLAAWAADRRLPTAVRFFAIARLAEWARPSGRDPVVGLWRPIEPRPAAPAAAALRPHLPALCSDASRSIRSAAVRAAAALDIKDAGAQLARLAADPAQADDTRGMALQALAALEDPRQLETARAALKLQGDATRVEALRLIAKLDPAAAITALEDRLAHGSILERQGAIAVLAAMPGEKSHTLLEHTLEPLFQGKADPALTLELIDAAAKQKTSTIKHKLDAYLKSSIPAGDPLAPYRLALAGGDPRKGREVFFSSGEAACQRCHKVSEAGVLRGGEVGPELSDVGKRLERDKLLESIVLPNQAIAQGFESVVIQKTDGQVVTGVLRGEDAQSIRLVTAEGKVLVIPRDEVEERKRGPSAMPMDVVQKLTKRELRDLIAYLAQLRGAATRTPGD